MPRDFRTLYQYLYTITDVVGMLFVLLMAPFVFVGHGITTPSYQLFVFWSITSWFILTFTTRYYYHTREGVRFLRRFRQTLKLSIFYVLSTTFFDDLAPFTKEAFLGIGVFLFGILLFLRILVNIVMHHLLVSTGLSQRVLIIGNGDNGEYVKNHITYNVKKGRRIAGFVNEDGQGERVLGVLNDIGSLVKKHQIEEIIFTMPVRNIHSIQMLQDYCSAEGIRLHWTPTVSRRTAYELGLDYFGAIPLVTLYQTPLDALYARFRKRLFDVILASGLLILLSPLFIIIAIAVKLTSRGPLLYKQKRVGVLHTQFAYYKFRTMKNYGRNSSQLDDEILTLIGSFLRRTNLDELPQLFNIIHGDMSFVGPRPFVAERDGGKPSSNEVLFTHQLLKPGVVGAEHLNAWRIPVITQESEHMRMEHDMLYVKQWSLSRDVKIALRSVFSKASQQREFKMRF